MTEQPQPISEIFQQYIMDFLTLLPQLIAALVIFFVGLYLASLVRRLVKRNLEKRTDNIQPIDLLSQLAYWLTVILAVALSLQMIGFNLTAFLAGLGIAGFTIGFALQDVSKNFIAGLIMLIQQPFQIGDAIEVSDFIGTVLAIDLRATQIRTLDGRLVMIPNGEVFVKPITNFSEAESRRVEISTGVAYDSEPGAVRQTALSAVAAVPGFKSEPPPEALFENFGSSTFDLKVYYWIDTSLTSVPAAKDAGLEALKQAFERTQIDMPLPAQEVYLHQ